GGVGGNRGRVWTARVGQNRAPESLPAGLRRLGELARRRSARRRLPAGERRRSARAGGHEGCDRRRRTGETERADRRKLPDSVTARVVVGRAQARDRGSIELRGAGRQDFAQTRIEVSGPG